MPKVLTETQRKRFIDLLSGSGLYDRLETSMDHNGDTVLRVEYTKGSLPLIHWARYSILVPSVPRGHGLVSRFKRFGDYEAYVRYPVFRFNTGFLLVLAAFASFILASYAIPSLGLLCVPMVILVAIAYFLWGLTVGPRIHAGVVKLLDEAVKEA